jgi:diguanylate cyclase
MYSPVSRWPICAQETSVDEKKMIKDFTSAAHAVIAYLHGRLGFELWMVTRTEGNDWIVLAAEDHGYGVKSGAVFNWADSFCSRMVEGLGPCIAPTSAAVPAYAIAPIGQYIPIGAYIGMPLKLRDGSLFGTLCAIDPSPQNETIMREKELIELLAGLLSGVLSSELIAVDALRQAERAELESMRDALTSLYNRRGWDQLLRKEEDRCRRYGHPACVISIDLDDLKMVNDTHGHAAGDALLVNASLLMRDATRTMDLIARIGGDEFGVLGVECDASAAQALADRLRVTFRSAGTRASFGVAMRDPGHGLQHAFEQADAAMYREKKARRSRPA